MASAILDIPMASHARPRDKGYLEWIRPAVARAAVEHGLDGERVSGRDFAVLEVDRTPPSFQPPGYEPGPDVVNIRPDAYVGGGEPPDWFNRLSDRPLVYVTLGTVFNLNVDLFHLVADALAAEPVDVVLTLGRRGGSVDSLGELPANIHAVAHLSPARVLPSADVVVCHAGYNTVIAALGAGVPVYAIPMGADQPFNAERLLFDRRRAQRQATDPHRQAGAADLHTAVARGDPRRDRRLISEKAFRTGARRIATEIDSMPGVEVAAQRREAALLERRVTALSVRRG